MSYLFSVIPSREEPHRVIRSVMFQLEKKSKNTWYGIAAIMFKFEDLGFCSSPQDPGNP